ncbi:MAG: L-threonylcarbamoyladenylate synthase [Desulfovibrio sp.]
MLTNMEKLLETVTNGGVLVYPTETLYAIGCDAFCEDAVHRVAHIKNRPVTKPLPMVIGSMDALEMITESVSPQLVALAEKFWPGPLSILVHARKELPDAVSDSDGYTSVRWSPHPVVQQLCQEAKTALVATSANPAGGEAVADPDRLLPHILENVDCVYDEEPFPSGGEPSTVVRLLEDGGVEILRLGAIAQEDILKALA